jgi:predicted transcriptional regulator
MNNKYLFCAFIPVMERGYNLQEIKILQLVFKKKINISEISRELNIDYKNTHRYIEKLHKDGLIILEPSKPIQGKKVYITLSKKILGEVLDELEAIILKKEDYSEIEELIKESRRKLKYIQLTDKLEK